MLHARVEERWKRGHRPLLFSSGPDESGKLIWKPGDRSRRPITRPQNYRAAGDALINETSAGPLSTRRFISSTRRRVHVARKIAIEIDQIVFPTVSRLATWPPTRVVYDEQREWTMQTTEDTRGPLCSSFLRNFGVGSCFKFWDFLVVVCDCDAGLFFRGLLRRWGVWRNEVIVALKICREREKLKI